MRRPQRCLARAKPSKECRGLRPRRRNVFKRSIALAMMIVITVIITQPGTSPRSSRAHRCDARRSNIVMIFLSVGRRYGASRLSPTTPG